MSVILRGDGFFDFFFDLAVVVFDELNEFIICSFYCDILFDDFFIDV